MIQNWSPCILLVGSESEAVTLGNMTVPAIEKKSSDISVWNSDFICVCEHLCVLLCMKESRKFKRNFHIHVHISTVHKCLRWGSNTSGYECISNVWFYSGKGLVLSFKRGESLTCLVFDATILYKVQQLPNYFNYMTCLN